MEAITVAASDVTLESLFTADASSAKVLAVYHDTTTKAGDDTSVYIKTYPHNLSDDQLFVIGWVKSSYSSNDEVYYFGLPYIDALGDTLMSATWDDTNVYLEWPWDGNLAGDHSVIHTMEWTIIVMMV